MRREGRAPLGEPGISPSRVLPLNAQDCESVRVRRAASLGVESQTPPPLPRSGGSASLQSLTPFPPRALAPLALRSGSTIPRDQPRPRQHKSQEEGCLLGAWQPLLPASHKAAASNTGGLAVFWNGGGKHTGAARRKGLFSHHLIILLSLLPSCTIWGL